VSKVLLEKDDNMQDVSDLRSRDCRLDFLSGCYQVVIIWIGTVHEHVNHLGI